MWWNAPPPPGLSPHGCCTAQGQAGCCPTGKSHGAPRPGSGLQGTCARPMGHVHALGPARGVSSPTVGGLGAVGVGQGSYVISSNVGESERIDEDVQAVSFSLISLSSSHIISSHTNSSHNISFFPTPDLAWPLPIGFFRWSSPLGIPAAAGGHGHAGTG